MKVLSLFDGIATGRLALQRVGVDVEQYFASEINEDAIKVAKKNFPDIIEIGDVCNVNSEDYCGVDLLIGGSPCFVGDTLVLTQNGYQCIKDINVGDYVLSHDNQMHKVVNWGMTGIKPIYNIKAMGSDEIKTTDNHRFFVRKMTRVWNNEAHRYMRTFDNPRWIETKNLDKNYYLGYAINTENKIPNWNGVDYFINQSTMGHKMQLDLTNKDFWYIVGRWLGDGWVIKNRKGIYRNKYNGIKICCSKEEANELEDKISKVFHCVKIEERTVVKFQISNTELGTFLSQFGQGAKNKFVPKFVMDLPRNLLKSFLSGYFDADGYYQKDIDKYKCVSISRELIYGIGQCVAKVYHRPFSIIKHIPPPETNIEGRIVNQNVSWILEFKKNNNKQDKAFYENGYIWVPIKSIIATNIHEKVYDITVHGAHSFTANGVIAHNCQSLSITKSKSRQGLDGKSKLFYEYLRIKNEVNPKYFLLENVGSMSEEDENTITKLMGVSPVRINSNHFSAQDRDRLYWTNIPISEFPAECKDTLGDILETDVKEKYYYNCDFDFYGEDKKVCATLDINGHDILKRVNSRLYKSPTLTCVTGGSQQKKVYVDGRCRKLTPVEYERLQTLDDGYTEGLSDTARYTAVGNGWTCKVIEFIFEGLK